MVTTNARTLERFRTDDGEDGESQGINHRTANILSVGSLLARGRHMAGTISRLRIGFPIESFAMII